MNNNIVYNPTICPTFNVQIDSSINVSLNPENSQFYHRLKLEVEYNDNINTYWLTPTGLLARYAGKTAEGEDLYFKCTKSPDDEVKAYTGDFDLYNFSPLLYINWEFYEFIDNEGKGNGTLTLYTYYDNNGEQIEIGSTTNNFSYFANLNLCVPKLTTLLPVENNQKVTDLIGYEDTGFILGYSDVSLLIGKIEPSTSNDIFAEITSVKVNGEDVNYNQFSHNRFDMGTIISNKYTIEVTNSRGASISETRELPIRDYTPVSLATNEPVFWDYDNMKGEMGTGYFPLPTIEFNGNYDNSYGSNNQLDIRIEMYSDGLGEYYDITDIVEEDENNYFKVEIIGNSYNVKLVRQDLSLLVPVDTGGRFKIIVSDTLNTMEYYYTLDRAYPVLGWGEDFVNIDGDLYIKSQNILDIITPIGSLFIYSENPSSIFGGTWQKINGYPLVQVGNATQYIEIPIWQRIN